MNFIRLPKVELHLHLDCSLSYAVVAQLAPSVTLDEYRARFIAPAKCTSLADFLTRPPQSIALMQTEAQLRLITQDLFEQLEQDGVVYAELRFAPLLHTEAGLAPHDVVAAVEAATAEAVQRTGIEGRLILCTLRHFSTEQSLTTVKLVEQFKGTTVAGFDIAADEAGFPIDAHIAAFRYAHAAGLPCTAHAGEARGPDSVWETLQYFGPSRLGHGVRSIEDPALLAHLRRHGVHLEVCPTSNIQTNVYADYPDHPIDRLYQAGLSVGINTDARTVTDITLTQEYEKLHAVFGWQPHHFLRCNLAALQAAFVPESLKQRLTDRVIEGYREVV
ncbi:MAG: adenosine deaminase [Anaerolineae bacterium]|nr:adenosine deaminase [Anaerolineae bacterium]